MPSTEVHLPDQAHDGFKCVGFTSLSYDSKLIFSVTECFTHEQISIIWTSQREKTESTHLTTGGE